VHHQTLAEERRRAGLGAIEELVRDDEIERRVFLLSEPTALRETMRSTPNALNP